MREIRLLDCTMRDGGYVNDWKFGNKNLISLYERIVDAGVDIVEIGFLDERRPVDTDRSIMPNTKVADEIFGDLDKKNTMVVAMIDYGTCSIENLQPCKDSVIDGIRVIFKKHIMHEAMEYCRQVKALGYKVFSQLVSITSYNDEELVEMTKLVNDVKPYAVSMVDTYGLLYPNDLLHYYEILDSNVDKDIQIGFHAHNNLQLAYANSLAFLDRKTDRSIVVDGTLYGMGKSAGNAPLELLSDYLNIKYNKNYNIKSELEAIDENVMDFYKDSPWGYKTFFYLCAKNKCHPNYLTYFKSKDELSESKTDELLSLIEPDDKKLLYSEKIAEKLYNDYYDGMDLDNKYLSKFKNEIGNRKILVIGPGKNIVLQQSKVTDFIKKENPYVISVNYISQYINCDCVFITNGKRYKDMTLDLKNSPIKTLATTNVECRNGEFDFVIHKSPILENNTKFKDNSFLMLINFLQSLGIKEIFCAGFDGYSNKECNYHNPTMEYSFIKQEASHLNHYMRKRIGKLRENISIKFITYSAYDQEDDINRASI